jgi:glycosyltransferase involved in cell wall biosynthesis
VAEPGGDQVKIAMVSLQANPLTAVHDRDAVGPRLHVAKLAGELHRQGHELTVYTRQSDRRLPCRVRLEDGFAVVHLPAGPARRLDRDDVVPHLGEFARHLEACWSDDVPDVVHAHHWTSGLAAVLSARQAAVPVVQSYHDPVGGDSVGAERLVGRSAAAVVATSGHEVDELVRLGVRRSVVTTVPWGVDTELFTPTGPAAARGAMSRVLVVSGLGPHAGVDDLISALPGVTWTELVVAGGRSGDAEVERLRAVAADHGVAERVTFLGHVPHSELPALLRSADVVACPERQGSSGVVPLEAMACGVPVVASSVGGLAESVVHGGTGLLVPPREPATLARALRSLLRDDVRRQELAFAAQDRARVRYGWDRVAMETATVYRRVAPSAPEQRRPVVLDRREEGAGV